MALTYSNIPEMNKLAPVFSLKATDGKTYSLDSFKDSKALVIVFICNHCPYVIAVQERLNELAKYCQSKNVGFIGINSNDVSEYPEDSMPEMIKRAKEMSYVFPYVLDETQSVAKAYGAQCTPDPFLYENVDGEFLLKYQGRIDDSWKDKLKVKSQDLKNAVDCILQNKPVFSDQKPSMGCNIKWKK